MLKLSLAFLLSTVTMASAGQDSNYIAVKLGRGKPVNVECISDQDCFAQWRALGCRDIPANGDGYLCRPYRRGMRLVSLPELPETFQGCDTDSDCADKVRAIGCNPVGNFLHPDSFLCWQDKPSRK